MSPARCIAAVGLSLSLLATGVGCKGSAGTPGAQPGTGGQPGAGGAAAGGSGDGGGPGSGGATDVTGTGGGAAGGVTGSGGAASGFGGGTAGGAGNASPDAGPRDSNSDSGAGDDRPAADAGAEVGASADVVVTFHNGGFWNDTSGNRIEAHGGGFILVGDTWYWIGEDKSQNSGIFKAVNCYSSKDLSAWKFENAIITRSTTADLNTSDRIIERPKVIYNDTTKQYVMWLHWDGNNYADAEAGVFSCATVCGNYTYHKAFQPNGNMSRDDTLFKDDDGTAYFISTANNNADLMVYQLTDDYLDIKQQTAKLWAGSSREAPAMFKQAGRYYLITSAATGWDSNQAKYGTATSIAGTWSALTNVGDATTFDTQAAYVIPVTGSKTTTYIYAGDRWQDPDLVSSKYIWLPLTLNGATIAMDNHDQWSLDLTTGQWSADDGYIPQAGWSLVYADSEETQAEDGHATNAFDGSSSTIWHTQYTGSAPAHPHEIQIDLGATYSVAGMRYLPRQDKDDHGMVADYQFYVSQDLNDWGTPVASGTFGTARTETIVPFPATSARYIRFVALSEINGQPWASIAELDLVPAP